MDYIKEVQDGIIINIKVIPGASKNEIFTVEGILKIRITAPPVDNKANKFVISYLSKLFKIPKSSIEILRGETSREKVIKFYITDTTKKSDITKSIISL